MDTASVSTPKRTRPFTLQLLLVTLAALAGRIAYVWFVKRDDTNTFKEGDAFFYSGATSSTTSSPTPRRPTTRP
jgi:hypothetical protein